MSGRRWMWTLVALIAVAGLGRAADASRYPRTILIEKFGYAA